MMTNKKLIHVVDDEDSIRRSVSFMLKTSGYEVETWNSGQAFLRDVKHAEHGCILLDVRMPEIDGLEVQRALAERGATMPVVIMTGHGDISIAIRAMKAGAVDFLEKPFEKAALIAAIEESFQRIADATNASARAADAQKACPTRQ
jgi:two-component system, LuxR family, response regulator FixJ